MAKRAWVLLAVGFAGALTVYAFTSFGLGMSLLIFFVGWPIAGTLVTIDDDLKGGWSNPDGSVRPPWLQMPFWGQIVAGLSLASAGAAIDAGWNTHEGTVFWLLAIAGFSVAVPMIRRSLRGGGNAV